MKIILDPLGDAVELTAEDDLKRYRIEKVHTAVGELQATLAGKFNTVRPYVARTARFDVEINGSVEFNGFLLDAEENVETGSVTLQGAGIANRLEETRPDYDNLGGSLTYSDITVEDAIEDYWTRTPFFSGNITVHPQPTESVATDAQTQFADANTQFNNLLSVPDTEPFIVQSGELQLAQTNFFIEAEDAVFTGTQIGTADTGVDYSNAQAVRLGANGDEVTDSKVFDYDIPSGEATFRARAELNNLDSEVSLQLDGTEIRDLSFGGQSDSISWRFGLGSTAPALSAGSHSFTIELKNYNSGNIEIDCVSFRDDRFSYTEDNTVDTQFNTLSGPELFPAGRQQAFDEALVSYNITDTTVDVTEAEGETINQLAVSSDDGTTFQTVTGTNSNTFAVSDDTRSVIPRLELGRYQFNATTSPDTGDGGHAIDVYELLTSGNNLTVIDDFPEERSAPAVHAGLEERGPQLGQYQRRTYNADVRRSSDGQSTTVIINTDAVDGHGTIVDPSGMRLQHGNRRFSRNFFINHDMNLLAGESPDPQYRGDALQVQVSDDAWDHEDELVERWYRKVKKGLPTQASIGFMPIDGEYTERNGERVYRYTDWMLREWSFVPIASNPEADVTSRTPASRLEKKLERLERKLSQVAPEAPDSSEDTSRSTPDAASADQDPEGKATDDGTDSGAPGSTEPTRVLTVQDAERLLRERDRKRREKAEEIAKRKLGMA